MNDTDSRPAVAFVVAHPDDVAFGMGGTATLLKKRYKLHVFCASRGERGYRWKGEGLAPPSSELGLAREKEERDACALIDADVTFLDQMDGAIFADQEICKQAAEKLAEIKPAAVFTMGALEKPDHAAACLIARQALSLAGIFWETELYMVTNRETHNPLYVNIFVNITDVVEDKKKLILCHKTQLPDADSWKMPLGRDSTMGQLAHCDYAEAYLTEFPLIDTRWGRKAGSILIDMLQ